MYYTANKADFEGGQIAYFNIILIIIIIIEKKKIYIDRYATIARGAKHFKRLN